MVMVDGGTGRLGSAGGIGGLVVVLMAAAVVWKTLGPVVSLWRHSFFGSEVSD